jgi:hypothetical protein
MTSCCGENLLIFAAELPGGLKHGAAVRIRLCFKRRSSETIALFPTPRNLELAASLREELRVKITVREYICWINQLSANAICGYLCGYFVVDNYYMPTMARLPHLFVAPPPAPVFQAVTLLTASPLFRAFCCLFFH